MAKTVSIEKRELLVAYQNEKKRTYEDTASFFGVGKATVSRHIRLKRETGKVLPKPQGGYRGKKTVESYSFEIGVLLHFIPDATLKEIANRLHDYTGAKFCESTIRNFMIRRNISRKKKTVFAAEQDRPDVQEAREQWDCESFKSEDCFFVDESGAKTNLTRTHGRSLKGTRLVAKVPQGHYKNCTCIAALTVNGMVACKSYDKPMNSELLKDYVKTELKPRLYPGAIVIWDNCPPHKNAEVREIIESTGAKLIFLPPYSPDLNPIEKAFSKLKAELRKMEIRCVETLLKYLEKIDKLYTPQECKNYIKSSNYLLSD